MAARTISHIEVSSMAARSRNRRFNSTGMDADKGVLVIVSFIGISFFKMECHRQRLAWLVPLPRVG